MFVMFDSNVWISQVGLKSDRAVKVLEFIRRKNAILAVPEIVKCEMEMKLREKLLLKKERTKEAIGYIANVLAEVENIALPTSDDIKDRVGSLVNDTGVQIKEMPLTMEAAKSSLDKILYKQQPSGRKKEQFTDGVIWANCLELLKESDVWFVSEDTDFYKNHKCNEGLASNLKCEAAKCPNKLRLFPDLEKLLQFAKEQSVPQDIRQDVREDVRRVSPEDEAG